MLYRTMQPEYKPAAYLSVVKYASYQRLISGFRTGRHDLRVDPARWADGGHLDRTDRLCLVCLIAQRTAMSGHSVWTSCITADFMTLCEPDTCGGFLRECFVCRKQTLSV